MAWKRGGLLTLTKAIPEEGQTRPRPTMREVAALAGASVKTVSRVINAEPGVSAELSSRVSAAGDRLGYGHNRTASSIRRTNGKSAPTGAVREYNADPTAY